MKKTKGEVMAAALRKKGNKLTEDERKKLRIKAVGMLKGGIYTKWRASQLKEFVPIEQIPDAEVNPPVEDEKINAESPSESVQFRIYIVWTIGLYPNGIRMLDIRAITSTLPKAQLYSKMLRRDKEFAGESWERVVIEPRVINHLYGQKLREMMVNTGRM